MTNWMAVIPILSALVGAIVGGVVVHLFTARRGLHKARRDQRVEFLILAYRRLTDASNREILSDDQCKGLETALSDIVLLGERAEVGVVQQFMQQMANKQESESADLEPLLDALRNSFRAELRLSATPMPRPYSLRMVP
ncbi:hypothetical protein [Rothia nasisuis]|uniref:hypothetical protein n=1 Tax=Rothia nasisuis TaxID=2109647 RepID=UPI001F28AD44|nr:hypothetical protein [Rothia nasisuis]